MNTEDVKTRVKQVMADNHITANSLANAFGVNQKTLHNQINDSAVISVSTILLIAQQIPNVSMEWLLRGVGEMYLPGNNDDTHSTPTAHLRDTSEREDMLLERIDMLKQKVQDKEELISSLKENIANLNNHIADLRHTLHYEEHSK